MAKPPTSVRSIRLTDEAWAWLAADAAGRGLTVNGAVAYLVNSLRSGVTPMKPPTPPPRIAPKRLYEGGEINIPARTGFKTTIGPQRPDYGSRLKKR